MSSAPFVFFLLIAVAAVSAYLPHCLRWISRRESRHWPMSRGAGGAGQLRLRQRSHPRDHFHGTLGRRRIPPATGYSPKVTIYRPLAGRGGRERVDVGTPRNAHAP